MLSIFKKFFGQSESRSNAATPPAPVRRAQPSEPTGAVPAVALAHLSLAAIVSRFPDELKATVLQQPDPAATIALPMQLIHKQLASGVVKMSLASLHRQAPPGVFGPLVPGDKRQVEIPLKEVFRHVKPQALQRRLDQRPLDTLENDFNLFGNADKPHAISPTTPENPPRRVSTTLHSNPPSRIEKAPQSAVQSAPLVPNGKPSGIAPPSGMRLIAPPVETNGSKAPAAPAAPAAAPAAPAAAPAAPAAPAGPTVTLPLAALANAWPMPICGEIAALDPATTVTLPGGAVSAGLAKGKVVFTWGEIRAGLQPVPTEPTALDEETALQLPLKIVAPAFLAATKNGKAERKGVQLDESIPALFSGAREPAPVVPAPVVPAPVVPAPMEEPPAEPVSALPVEPMSALPAEPAPEPPAEIAAPEPQKVPATVGEVFGEPDRHEFTPAEIVAGTVKLPGVAGAIVALQEGLPVATSLPEGIKSELVAAFLPQIFARLNQYSGEMKLGEVDDLLFTTHGAHCQIYRLGFVYFAVLGHPGESLPWHELQLIAAELRRQTNQ